jgi:hypothetical protein
MLRWESGVETPSTVHTASLVTTAKNICATMTRMLRVVDITKNNLLSSQLTSSNKKGQKLWFTNRGKRCQSAFIDIYATIA